MAAAAAAAAAVVGVVVVVEANTALSQITDDGIASGVYNI